MRLLVHILVVLDGSVFVHVWLSVVYVMCPVASCGF